jgi:hypothetical protein
VNGHPHGFLANASARFQHVLPGARVASHLLTYITLHVVVAAAMLPGGTLVALPNWLQFRSMLWAVGVGPRLQALRMHSVGFTGPIGNLDYYFPALRMLDLRGNAFWGPLPRVNTNSWLYLDVSNQMLTGGAGSAVGWLCSSSGVSLRLMNTLMIMTSRKGATQGSSLYIPCSADLGSYHGVLI